MGKIKGVDMQKAANVRSVGVIGAGTMGTGVAMNFLKKGIPVYLIDAEQRFLDRGIQTIKDTFKERVKKGKSTKFYMDQWMSCLRPTLDYSKLSDVDLVIEAVFENMDVKKKVMKRLDGVCKPDAI